MLEFITKRATGLLTNRVLAVIGCLVLAGYAVLLALYVLRGAELSEERLRYQRRETQIQNAVAWQESENRRIEQNMALALKGARDEHDRVVERQRVAHADAVRSLRVDPARSALRPAATAPAECRNHAAPAHQLSVADAEFLIGMAAEADAVVEQLADAQRYIAVVNKYLANRPVAP